MCGSAFHSRYAQLVKKVEKTSSAILTMISVVKNLYQMSINGRCFIWDLAEVKLIVEESAAPVMVPVNSIYPFLLLLIISLSRELFESKMFFSAA